LSDCDIDFGVKDVHAFLLVHYAAEFGNLIALKWLWLRGNSLDAKSFSMNMTTNITLLHLAAGNSHEEVVDFILKSGVKIDVRMSEEVPSVRI
jgi:ankyrin repeat protein